LLALNEWKGPGPIMTNEQDAKADERGDTFEVAAAEWDKRLAEAGAELDAAAPSPTVWERISARVDHLEASRGTLTISSDDGVWEYFSPGVHRKLLHVDADAGWQAFLMKVEPGAGVPPHSHPRLEECLVLEGEFEVDGAVVRKGDLHLGFAGHNHAALTSPAGALLYIRGAIGD
jgi:anti-sigma factor ChrR (cupin superfamily)